MALYDVVNGVYRKVTKKYDSVDGVYRKVKAAYDPVDGVYRQYFSGGATPASTLSVGDSVWLNINGSLTEFLVVHQGNPDSAMYDASCDGTWLLSKNVLSSRTWDEDQGDPNDERDWRPADNYYGDSLVYYWLDYEFINSIDSNVKSQIKHVKIPYWNGAGISSLSTKTFLLSGYEVGWTTNNSYYFPVDGACLNFFAGCSDSDSRRIAYYTGTAATWWLRSAYKNGNTRVWFVTDGGGRDYCAATNYRGLRPAFILDSNTPIAQSGGKNIIE